MENEIAFRYAEREDIPLILEFIKKLAVYEKTPEYVVATEAQLEEWMFDRKRAEVIFLVTEGKEVGFALFFESFVSYLGKGGIYIDDLYVEPQYRGKGYGKALLRHLAEMTIERGCGRLEWCCLNWNQPSIDFYISMGAVPADECRMFRAAGDALTGMLQK